MDFQNLLDQLLPIAVVFITGLVPVVLLVIRVYVKRWLDVELSAKQMGMIESLTYDAVNYAEEQASKAIKEGVPAPSKRTKLDTASDFLIDHAREQGLPEMATHLVKERIEAALGNTRQIEGKAAPDCGIYE